MTYKKPKGTIDYYPEDKATQDYVFEKLRNVADRYNFKRVETPAFEDFELIKAKAGEEISQQMFMIEKRGNETLALRAELNPSMARMFVEKQKELPKPVKWFNLSKMWRYERPQAGRLREFYQLSVELFGSDKAEADAEIISLVIDCFKELGLTKDDFSVKINNRVLLSDFVKSIGYEYVEKVLAIIDKKLKIPKEAFDEELKKLNLDDEQIKKVNEFLNIKDIDEIQEGSEGLANLKQTLDILENKKDFIELDLSTVRGLAYYTGTVFEVWDKNGKFRALAGGGRYDNMIGLYGGQECPAVGFGIGYATLYLLLEEKGLLPKPNLGPEYFVAITEDSIKKDAFNIIDTLRQKCSVSFDLASRNLSNQIKYASSIKAKNLIVIGPDEIKSGKVKIKDLESGKEEEKSISDI